MFLVEKNLLRCSDVFEVFVCDSESKGVCFIRLLFNSDDEEVLVISSGA